jgi:hypothetical protein
MCYGDPGHGKDDYYQRWLDEQDQEATRRDMEREIYKRCDEED